MIRVGLAALALTAVVSCAPPPERDGRPVVRVAMRPYASYARLFLTEHRGFFEEEGIDIEFVSVPSGATSIPLLMNGRIDVLTTGMSPAVLQAINTGGRVRFVGSGGWLDPQGCSPVSLVGRPGFVEGRPSGRDDGVLRVSMPNEPSIQYIRLRWQRSCIRYCPTPPSRSPRGSGMLTHGRTSLATS